MNAALRIIQKLERIALDNSPSILTGIGVAGVIATSWLTGRSTVRYMTELGEEGYFDRDYTFDRSYAEHVKAAWKIYIPPVVSGTSTIVVIVLANRVSYKRTAALVAAYSVLQEASREYRNKIVEVIGAKKEASVRDEIQQTRVQDNPPSSEVLIVNGSQTLCYDAYTGRYFRGDIETIRQAVNTINHKINTNFYASLTDFYELIGLPRTSISDEVGWNSDELLEVQFSAVLVDNKPCMSFDFLVTPVRHYYKVG